MLSDIKETFLEMMRSGECSIFFACTGIVVLVVGILTLSMVTKFNMLSLGLTFIICGLIMMLLLLCANDVTGNTVPRAWINQLDDLYDLERLSEKLIVERHERFMSTYL